MMVDRRLEIIQADCKVRDQMPQTGFLRLLRSLPSSRNSLRERPEGLRVKRCVSKENVLGDVLPICVFALLMMSFLWKRFLIASKWLVYDIASV